MRMIRLGKKHHRTSDISLSTKGKEMFYLTIHSTHFIYGYMASDIWLRTILIVRKETHYCHIGYSLRLTARVLLYASSHRQDNTFVTPVVEHCLEREIAQWVHHEGSIRRPIEPWANTLTTELHLAPLSGYKQVNNYEQLLLLTNSVATCNKPIK